MLLTPWNPDRLSRSFVRADEPSQVRPPAAGRGPGCRDFPIASQTRPAALEAVHPEGRVAFVRRVMWGDRVLCPNVSPAGAQQIANRGLDASGRRESPRLLSGSLPMRRVGRGGDAGLCLSPGGSEMALVQSPILWPRLRRGFGDPVQIPATAET